MANTAKIVFIGAGSAALSSLPLLVSGKALRPTNEAGIMYSGRLASRKLRIASAEGVSLLPPTT